MPSQANKALTFAQLIQYFDDRSLSLIMRDAPNDGPKALKITWEKVNPVLFTYTLSSHRYRWVNMKM